MCGEHVLSVGGAVVGMVRRQRASGMSCRPMASVTEMAVPQCPVASASANATPMASASGMCCTVSAKNRSQALRLSAAVGPTPPSLNALSRLASARPPPPPLPPPLPPATPPRRRDATRPVVSHVPVSTESVSDPAPALGRCGNTPCGGAGGACEAAPSSGDANAESRPTRTTLATTMPTAMGAQAYSPSAASDTSRHSCSRSMTADSITASARTAGVPSSERRAVSPLMPCT